MPVATSDTAAAGPGQHQFLTFFLDGEEYGVDILRVQEIKGCDRVTPIPNTCDFVRGVINLRGVVVPIIDLRRRFGKEPAEPGGTAVVVVLKVRGEHGDRTMGFVVDAVSDVYTAAAGELRPPPDFGAAGARFVTGLATVDRRMIVLLDVDQLADAV